MRRISYFRISAFRWILRSTLVFFVASLLLFGFIYWQTARYLTAQLDEVILVAAKSIAGETAERLPRAIVTRIEDDPRDVKSAALFDASGNLLVGNLRVRPPDLLFDGKPRTVSAERFARDGFARIESVRAVGLRVGGRTVVIARDMSTIAELREAIMHALILGVFPALVLGLLAGAAVSMSTVRRIEGMNAAIQDVMGGRLQTRLPRHPSGDDLDHIASGVNAMLDEIERLMNEVKTSGEAVAHDLHTPLTRLRNRLEQARDRGGAGAVQALESAVREIDTLVTMMQALLRIGEIEYGRRRSGFRRVDITAIAGEVAELFAPAAEDKRVHLVTALAPAWVQGDGDLLFELLMNLIDNAVKFTPPGGTAFLRVQPHGEGLSIEVEDDGPGIPEPDRKAAMRRFYRADPSRQTPGFGLGLSLVDAIVRLHGFSVALETGSKGTGLRVAIVVPVALPAELFPAA